MGDLVDGFGANVIAHGKRALDTAGKSWTSTNFRNRVTGMEEPKASARPSR